MLTHIARIGSESGRRTYMNQFQLSTKGTETFDSVFGLPIPDSNSPSTPFAVEDETTLTKSCSAKTVEASRTDFTHTSHLTPHTELVPIPIS